jgi:hypothetical protein
VRRVYRAGIVSQICVRPYLTPLRYRPGAGWYVKNASLSEMRQAMSRCSASAFSSGDEAPRKTCGRSNPICNGQPTGVWRIGTSRTAGAWIGLSLFCVRVF